MFYEWTVTQNSLAKEIIKLAKPDNVSARPNVKARGAELNREQKECIDSILSYFHENQNVNIKMLVLSLCKFLGDTSHIVMAYALLSQINNNIPENDVNVNLQLSERPMLIRNCLPNSSILNFFDLDLNTLDKLIIWVSPKTGKIVKNKINAAEDTDIETKITEDIIEEPGDEATGESVEMSGYNSKTCWRYHFDPYYKIETSEKNITNLLEEIKDI